jgi:uncharacterized membrane protein YqjE
MWGSASPGGHHYSDSIRRLLDTITAFLSTKLELVGIELQEEKRKIVRLLMLAVATFLFGALSVTLLTLVIIAIFWDSYRIPSLMIMSGIYLAIAIFLYARLRRQIEQATRIFDTTVEELKKDNEWAQRHL